jgi:hypothetical protein
MATDGAFDPLARARPSFPTVDAETCTPPPDDVTRIPARFR